DQAKTNGDITTSCPANALPGAEPLTSGKVVERCPAGQPCGTLGPGEIDSQVYECARLKDLAAALIGLDAGKVMITRLEANLPRAALNVDLTLSSPTDQTPVENNIKAKQTKGSPPSDCTI